MKKLTLLKSLLLAVGLLAGTNLLQADPLLVENFDYTIGSLLTANGWTAHSGAGTQAIDVTNGLTFTGYAGSGIGGAANLDNNGEDVHKTFTPQTSGTVYAAFLVQTQSTNSAGYFFHLGAQTIGSTFWSRVYVNATGNGLGISGSSVPSTYVPITAGTPTLVVVKYNITTKVSSLFVLNSYSATEPATPNQTFAEGTVGANVGSVALRQYNASQRIIVDGIRVATTWADAVAPASANPVAATPTFSPAAGTYTSAQSVTISCTTPGATIYYTTDGSTPDNTKTLYTGAISVTATTTIKAIAYAAGYDPSAVASATYTINAVPTITVTEVTIPAFSATAGSSQDQTITVNGTNLTGDITLALSGTDKAMFELSEYEITPTSGTVTDKVITITYTPTAPGSHAATLTLSSQDATDVIRNLTGTASLAQPTVNTPTNITNTGLTLNWNEVTGATEYEVNVYTKTTGTVTATDLFISEYGEGSGGNKKYVEIFNGTGNDVDLSNYVIKKAVNGADWNTTVYSFPASTVLVNGSTFVLANNSADVIGATAYDGFCTWNGNDAIGLFKNDVLIDVFGTPTSDPGDGIGWTIAGITKASVDHILIRKPTVTSPTTDWDASAGTTAEDSQWIVSDFLYNATNQTTDLGSHTMDGFGTIKTPIIGSPFTVSATSLQIGGLTAATTYYYTVTAKNGSYVSPASVEASAATLGTAISNVAVRGIFVRNGQVVVTAPAAGERIEIFNAVGQRLVSKLATAGENAISVSAKGVLVVKFGSEVTKVILP